MRLKKIKLAGFKSFVDPTTIQFVGNLSSVVGPNGCGKSNVIDAVRWVMGESNAKHLRGGALTDVIFSGSTSRKPVGQATVELLFDNAEGKLGGEYASYAEIAIKRQVTRDGQSKYFLNGQACRRRDVTDIFLGTGLGPRSYAIIEQGMISRVIEAKPDDLRIFLEEAAGISKYKERRRETENRIQHTQDNLARLNDLRDELAKQLRHLERQAEAAARYNELKQQHETVSLQVSAMAIQRLNTEIDTIEQQIREYNLLLESHYAKVQHLKTAQEKGQLDQTQAHHELNEVQKQYYATGAEIAKVEQALQHQAERKAQWIADKEDAIAAMAYAEQQRREDNAAFERLTAELIALRPQTEIAIQEESAARAAEVAAETALENWREEFNATQHNAALPGRQAESEKAKITQLEKQLQQNQERRDRLNAQKAQLQSVDASEIDIIDERIDKTQDQLDRISEQCDTQQMEKNRLVDVLQSLRPQIQRLQQSLHAKKGELTALQTLQSNALGKNSEARSDWLANHGLEQAAYLAEKLKVTSGWEVAVETVLGDCLGSLGISQTQLIDAASDIAALEGVGIHLMAWHDQSRVISADPRRLSSMISGCEHLPESLYNQIEQVYIAADLSEARALLETLGTHQSVITPEGFWLSADWLKVKASEAQQAASLLKREEVLKALIQAIDEEQALLEEQTVILAETEESLKSVEAQKESLQQEKSLQQQELSSLQSERRIKQNKLEEHRNRANQMEQDFQECETRMTEAQKEIQQSRLVLAEAVEQMSRCHERLAILTDQKSALQEASQAVRLKAREARDKSHEMSHAIQMHESQLQAIENNQSRSKQQMDQLTQKIEQLHQQLADYDEPVAALKMSLEATLEKRLQIEDVLHSARDTVAALDNQLRDIGTQINAATQAIEQDRAKGEQLKLSCQSLIVRRETVTEKLQGCSQSLEAILQSLPESADETVWQEELQHIEQKIQRLGAINLAAIQEFDDAKQRKEYLDAQLADLTEALTTLENAIKKIDKETRAKFQETFEKVNSSFKVLFPQLFGGGQAQLEMTGEDLLDTGITVMARPPGKKNTSIVLLSGGEKALTAVALVFAIFQLNPAPFCMLDEVDAPLDDTNVGRFCQLVKEMSQNVQFIFISHNKVAIEMAEQLHGVTMREPGVSRMVTVDIEEAKSLAIA